MKNPAKPLFVTFSLVFLMCILFWTSGTYSPCEARTFEVWLSSLGEGGTTTVQNPGSDPTSGNSTMVISGTTNVYTIDLYREVGTGEKVVSVQVDPTGVTPCAAAKARGSDDYSGVTFGVYMSLSNFDTTEAWAGVSTYKIRQPVALSGNSTYVVDWTMPTDLPEARYARFEFATGITPFDQAKIRVNINQKNE